MWHIYQYDNHALREDEPFTLHYNLSYINNYTYTVCAVTPVQYGRVSNYKTREGSQVTLHCLEGYEVIGNDRATCTNNGTLDLPFGTYKG